MPNTYFDFKQFRIEQAVGGMKVSTDACIQGAWVYEQLDDEPTRVLDIGAGTGLLSLMLSQAPKQTKIDAIEIETAAAEQCQYNFDQVAWRERLHLHHIDLQSYVAICEQQYDVIISNPPFFENQLRSAESKRMQAFHDDSLPKADLAAAIVRLLDDHGKAYMLYPTSEWTNWEKAVQDAGLHIAEELHIYPNTRKAHNRIVGTIVKYPVAAKRITPFYIRNAANEYDAAFVTLLSPFYLNL